MTRVLLAVLLLVPLSASAEFLDVIEAKLKDKCSVATYVAIKNDFNDQWGKSHGYQAEIASAAQSNDLATVYWLGHSHACRDYGPALRDP